MLRKALLVTGIISASSLADIVLYEYNTDKIYTDTQNLINPNEEPNLYYKSFSEIKNLFSISEVENQSGQLERLYTGWIDFRAESNQNPFISQSVVNFIGIVQVPCNIVNNIRSKVETLDADSSKLGVQVKLYTLNTDKGKWVENGYGLFISSPVDINSLSTNLENLGNLVTDENQICANGDNHAYLAFKGKDTKYGWNALGYVVNIPTQICNISIKDNSNNKISTYVEILSNNECSDFSSGITNSNGNVSLSFKKYCSNLSFKVSYYDPYVGYTQVYDTAYQPGNICDIKITVEDINKCEINGKVKDDNQEGLQGKQIDIYTSNYKVHKWGYTDKDGNYSIKVPCNVNLDIYIDGRLSLKANVNNSLSGNEKTDNGKLVNLIDYVLPNKEPHFWGYVYQYNIYTGKDLKVYVSGYDKEGDFPLSYEVLLKNNGTVERTIRGNISYFGEVKENTFDLSGLQEGIYQIFIKGVDKNKNLNEAKIEYYIRDVYIYTRNLPPIIKAFYLSKTKVNTLSTIDIYALVEDLEGDNLTGSLQYKCYNSNTNTLEMNKTKTDISQLLNNKIITIDFTGENINQSDICEFTLNVSDGTNQKSETRILSIVNDPPTINIWVDNPVIYKSKTSSFIVHSYVADDTAIASCQWYVNGVATSQSCDDITVNTSDYPAGIITIKLVATDNKNLSSTKEIQVELRD